MRDFCQALRVTGVSLSVRDTEPMQGWTADGQPVELTPWQARVVEAILAAGEIQFSTGRKGPYWVVVHRARMNGWRTVQATVAKLQAGRKEDGS